MASVVHLDTHVVVWLYEGDLSLFPTAAQQLLEESELGVSPMVELELEYLHEIDRIGANAVTILGELARTIGVAVVDASFASVVQHARSYRWTRDPFDRLIVAHAELEGAPLLTKDATIRRHFKKASWSRKR